MSKIEQLCKTEQKCIDTIRTLAIDAIEKAKSGHPGMPMGAAPMGFQLFAKTMNYNPADPKWINRDRFVLSAGHGSMLLYSLLHLTGFDLPLEEIKNFRQWNSLTPGHPEYGHTVGVDATTGPLGQGIGMAVGMAMAEAHLGAVYNRDAYPVIDHHTYAICGDGDLMEGISHEAASLAGHLKLGKLIVLYDSNDISLDGKLNLSFSENVAQRFESYGWQVLRVEDGNDLEALQNALAKAQSHQDCPTLIEVKTVIGYGSPNKAGKGGHGGTHGSPLGEEEVKLTKQAYGWPTEPAFYIPEEVKAYFKEEVATRTKKHYDSWKDMFEKYQKENKALAEQLLNACEQTLPENWKNELPVYSVDDKAISTRVASGKALNALAKTVPYIFGGAADLESSTMTHMNGLGVFSKESYEGRNVYFGVREFAMSAAVNGMALHGGLRAYASTFFVFTDYLRPALRLAAIMNLPSIFVLTHDSIAVGEDGPTHEPIEQLASIRVIPNVQVIRPADANETSEAWAYAIENQKGPVVLVLSRQNLPILPEAKGKDVTKGAYVLSESKGMPVVAQLLATGSEVQLALKSQQELEKEGIGTRVISMPSWELFEQQPISYREQVILPEVKKRLAIEMAYPLGWEKYVGEQGRILAIKTYGASAPGDKVVSEYGFNPENVIKEIKEML